MEMTNNPDMGTGYTPQEAVEHIATLLDSPEATTETVDADSEVLETSTVDNVEQESEEIDLDTVDDEQEDDTDEETTDEDNVKSDDKTTVDVNGNTVTLKELKNGYLRQADYTRKSQELAEHKRQYQLQQYDGAQIRGELAQSLDGIMQQVAAVFPMMQEPDWAYLAENDPAEYVREKEMWAKRESAIRQVHEAQNVVNQKNAEYANAVKREAYKKAHDDLKQAYPDQFGDKAKAKTTLDQVTNWLSDSGFSMDEINSVSDAKIIITAYKAMLYDQIQNKVPTAVAKIERKPALTMPGSSLGKTSSADQSFKRDLNRLKHTGSLNDAASVISRLL